MDIAESLTPPIINLMNDIKLANIPIDQGFFVTSKRKKSTMTTSSPKNDLNNHKCV